jgi:small-conductance mechanosensitive channel
VSRLFQGVENFNIESVTDWERLFSALIVFLVGFFVLRIGTRMLMRAVGKGLREQSSELIRKTIVYIGATVLFVMVLNAAGVSVGALLGAAGVLGIAVGIASQASLSNIISGLFLVSERFFEIGDIVRVGEHVGIVQSIDLLSIKLKTFDNLLIRIPNQLLIEKDFLNITRYSIRRMDFTIFVPAECEVDRVLDALRTVSAGIPQVLEEPEPLCLASEFGENGLKFLLGVWFERPHFLVVRNGVMGRIQTVFRERGIPIRTKTIRLLGEDGATGELSHLT